MPSETVERLGGCVFIEIVAMFRKLLYFCKKTTDMSSAPKSNGRTDTYSDAYIADEVIAELKGM